MKKKTTCIKKSVESSPVADIAAELGGPAKRLKLKQLRPPLSDLQLQGEHVKDLQHQGEHVQVVFGIWYSIYQLPNTNSKVNMCIAHCTSGDCIIHTSLSPVEGFGKIDQYV